MRIAALLLALAAAAPAWGEDASRDFCADRPGLGTPACTLDPGRVQVELGLIDWTKDRPDALVAGDLLVRVGLGSHTEAQIGWTAFGHAAGHGGTGDVTVALRQNLVSPDGSGTTLAIMPYATLPTGGRAIGAGDWSAGVRVPFGFSLSPAVSVAFTPDIEAAVDADRDGRHLAYGGVAGISAALGEEVSATAELSLTRDRDPAGHSTEALAGVSLAWTPAHNLQLDAGANLGLNQAAPDLELSAGNSRRF
jgi:hypothetical protein